VLAWLADLFNPIARHPAATAVATLVVVAGVAGALYVRGEHKVAEPTAGSAADTPVAFERSAVVMTPGRDNGITASLEEGDVMDGEGQNAEPAAPAEPAPPRVTVARPGYAPAAKDVGGKQDLQRRFSDEGKKKGKLAPAGRPAGARGPRIDATTGAEHIVQLEDEDDGRNEVLLRDSRNRPMDPSQPLGGGAGGSAGGGDSEQRRQTSAPPPAPEPNAPPPSQPAVVNPDKQTQDSKPGSYRVYLQNPADNSYMTAKEPQLEQALRRNDCQVAGKIANDIIDRSYEYYVANWRARAEKNCKKFVDAERSKRFAARKAAAEKARASAAKAKKGGSSSGAKGGKASQAAPRSDDAAESPAADSNQ
jgi:hypothetical protein